MQEDSIEFDISSLLNKANNSRGYSPERLNGTEIPVLSKSKHSLNLHNYSSYTEMSESAFQTANRDFAKLFSSAGFSKERSFQYSNSILKSLKNGNSGNTLQPEVIRLSFSMSEKTSFVTDRFNMIDKGNSRSGSYINGAAKGMRTISALYFKELKVSINLHTGKIRIDRKKISTIEVKTTVLVRGLNDKEAKYILGSALNYLNEKDSKKTNPIMTGQSADGVNVNTPDKKKADSYSQKLISDLRSLQEKMAKSTDFSKNIFESIIDIQEILFDKNYRQEDILKLTLDMLTPLGIIKGLGNKSDSEINDNGQAELEKNRIDLSI